LVFMRFFPFFCNLSNAVELPLIGKLGSILYPPYKCAYGKPTMGTIEANYTIKL
jgi:hypothetical protein